MASPIAISNDFIVPVVAFLYLSFDARRADSILNRRAVYEIEIDAGNSGRDLRKNLRRR